MISQVEDTELEGNSNRARLQITCMIAQFSTSLHKYHHYENPGTLVKEEIQVLEIENEDELLRRIFITSDSDSDFSNVIFEEKCPW